jgi:Rieske Fe-S protein
VPAVFPESNSRVSLGPRERFKAAKASWFPEYRLWVYGDEQGYYAVSAICPHLGCTVSAQESGGYFCPCHGSRFKPSGAVVGGPAPGPLIHLELSIAPDGHLVVDQQQEVRADVRLKL